MTLRQIRWLILIILAVIFLLTAGYSPKVNIEERAIVHAVGVDKAKDGYEVSLQIFSTTQSGASTPIDPSQPNMKVVSAKGETVYEGVRGCELILGSDAFIGHNKLILFGSSLYGAELDRLLDWFAKENENYLGVTVAYAEKTAKEVLEAPLTDGAAAIENIEDVIDYAVNSGATVRSDLLTLINELDEGGVGALPVIAVTQEKGQSGQKEGEEQNSRSQSHIEIKKTALLKDKKAAGFLDKEQTAGLLWLTGEMKDCTAAVRGDNSSFNIAISAKNIRRRLETEGETVVLKVTIKAKAKAVEDVSTQAEDEIGTLAREKITSQCAKCTEAVLSDIGSDSLGIMKGLKFYQPDYYEKVKDRSEEMLRSMRIELDINMETEKR